MIDITSNPKSLRSLINDTKKEKYNFDLPIQRELVWNNKEKSWFIDTIFRYKVISPALINKHSDENIFDVVDGKQRLTTIKTFENNELRLSKDLSPLVIDDIEYEIAGKKFEQLDEELQSRFYDKDITVITMIDATDEEVSDIFSRINLGRPLNNSQRRSTVENVEVRNIINSITSHAFFEKMLTPAQKRSAVEKDIVRQTLMLIEKSDKYDFGSFKNADINKFLQYYNKKVSNPENKAEIEQKLENINKALDRLDQEFNEDTKINRLTLPFAIYGMYRMYKDSKSTGKYVEWLRNFLNTWGTDEEYMKYCQGGTANAENVNGRLQYFRAAIRTIQ